MQTGKSFAYVVSDYRVGNVGNVSFKLFEGPAEYSHRDCKRQRNVNVLRSPPPPTEGCFSGLALHEALVWNSSVCDNLNISFQR